uniref:Uncharacterized protein n=1 Tax=Ditylenchus dipsaci TaxID=166011 RepID=A0A915DE08_9BILA
MTAWQFANIGRGREYSTKEWNPELPSFLVKESYEAEEVFTRSVHCIPAKCPTLEEDTRIEEELIDKEEGDELENVDYKTVLRFTNVQSARSDTSKKVIS